MKGKIALFSVALLFVALIGIVTFSTPVVAGSTITVDGDPSDWTGTAGSDNTYVVSAGEGIWKDAAGDDTGNGSYVYMNGTHDHMTGPPWNYPVAPFIMTGWPNGGCNDLTEFRVTADSNYLYLMFRVYNMGNSEIANQWGDAQRGLGGKIMFQVTIDQDRDGTGRTDMNNSDTWANFLVASAQAWEAMVTITGRGGTEGARVELEDGSIHYLDQSDIRGNGNYSCAEIRVPISIVGDPAGKTWRFGAVVGHEDGGHYRAVCNSTPWAAFHPYGGEGLDNYADMGNDPNMFDMAFTTSKAAQEAMIGAFSSLAVIEAYQDIKFSSSGPVGGAAGVLNALLLMAPWIILAVAVAATAISVVIYGRKRTI